MSEAPPDHPHLGDFPGDDGLLIAYLHGELSEDQIATVENRLGSESDLARRLESLAGADRLLLESLSPDATSPVLGLQRRRAVQRKLEDTLSGSQDLRQLRRLVIQAGALAAVIALIAGLVLPTAGSRIRESHVSAYNDSMDEDVGSAGEFDLMLASPAESHNFDRDAAPEGESEGRRSMTGSEDLDRVARAWNRPAVASSRADASLGRSGSMPSTQSNSSVETAARGRKAGSEMSAAGEPSGPEGDSQRIEFFALRDGFSGDSASPPAPAQEPGASFDAPAPAAAPVPNGFAQGGSGSASARRAPDSISAGAFEDVLPAPPARAAESVEPGFGFDSHYAFRSDGVGNRQRRVVINETLDTAELRGKPSVADDKEDRPTIDSLHVLGTLFQPEEPLPFDPISTFSLNVSDVSFRRAEAQLAAGNLPEPASIRPEEFFNAIEYTDPAPLPGERVRVTTEFAEDPFRVNGTILRIRVQTAALGRDPQRPLNLTLAFDNSGSMQREDRRAAFSSVIETLEGNLGPADQLAVVSFDEQPRVIARNARGNAAQRALRDSLNQLPMAGSNIDAAIATAYSLARQQFDPAGVNRILFLTDGAGRTSPDQRENLVARIRDEAKNGIAFDALGVGWEGVDDQLLADLTRYSNGSHLYANDPAEAAELIEQSLVGRFRPVVRNTKVQVEFDPEAVIWYQLIGYDSHRLNAEDFRNDAVDGAEIAAADSGTAIYLVRLANEAPGPVGTVRVRYEDAASSAVKEESFPLVVHQPPPPLSEASGDMIAASSAAHLALRLRREADPGIVPLRHIESLLAEAATEHPMQQPVYARLQRMTSQTRSLLNEY